MSSHSLSPIVPNPWASCCVCDVFIQLSTGHFVQDTVKDSTDDYWNPKRWLHLSIYLYIYLSFLDRWCGESSHEWVSEGLSPHEPMLAVNNDCVVLQVFFSNSQDNCLHNFARHCSEADRQVVTRVIPLALLENSDVCQLSVIWDLLWFCFYAYMVIETYTKVVQLSYFWPWVI